MQRGGPTRPLLITHVLHRLSIGGLENGVVNLINLLPNKRFRHAVVCIEDHDEFARRIQRDDVEVVDLHRSRQGVWRMRARLWQLLRRMRPDIVHSRNLSGLDALLPARLAGLTTLHSEHGFDASNLHGTATRQTLLRRLHRPLVHQYACVSRDIQHIMVRQWGIAGSRVRQIYNGVDTSRFEAVDVARIDRLPESLRHPQAFVVGTVGRLDPVKDQSTLLAAAAEALRQRPALRARLRVVLIGDGPQAAALSAQAQALDVAPLCWMAGARGDVPQLMQAMHVFALPSMNEGISNTLLEAMATGLPVLATAVGGNVELVDDGVTGRLFAPSDVVTLADCLVAYADDEELRRRHGRAGQARAASHFSLQAMLTQYATMYEELAAARRHD